MAAGVACIKVENGAVPVLSAEAGTYDEQVGGASSSDVALIPRMHEQGVKTRH